MLALSGAAAVVAAVVLEGAVAGGGAVFWAALGDGEPAGGAPLCETVGTAAAAGSVPALWRPIDPVTVSMPCSSTVTREYNRSRSLFKVSMADANRLVSSWLSLAIHWICCACRARSAEATCSRRHPIEY